MSLGAKMERHGSAGEAVVAIENNYFEWLAGFEGRLAAKGASANVFDEKVYSKVEQFKSIIHEKLENEVSKGDAGWRLNNGGYGTAKYLKSNAESDALILAKVDRIPEETYKTAFRVIENDEKAWSCVQKGLKGSILLIIKGLSARMAFLEVEKMYGGSSQGKALKVSDDLHNIKMADLSPDGVTNFLNKRHQLVLQAQTLFPDEPQYSWERQRRELARGLPINFALIYSKHVNEARQELTYHSLVSEIVQQTEAPFYIAAHPNQAAELVLYQHNNNNNNGNGNRNGGNGSHQSSNNNNGNNNRQCHACKSTSHHIRDCKAPNAEGIRAKWHEKMKKLREKQKSKRGGQQSATPAIEAPRPASFVTMEMAVLANNKTVDDRWIIDSGATSHFTNNRAWLYDYVVLPKAMMVSAANDNLLAAVGIGKICIKSELGSVEFKDVYHVPQISVNLLSVSALRRKGLRFVVESNGTCTFFNGNTPIVVGAEENKLFRLKGETKVHQSMERLAIASHDQAESEIKLLDCGFVEPEEVLKACLTIGSFDDERILLHCNKPPISLYEWHVALGHPSLDYMKKMAKRVQGLEKVDFDEVMPLCEGCAKGKMTRPPFPASKTVTNEKLALIHSDYAGPFPVASLKGHRYYLTFLDDYTGMAWVYTKARKDAESTCATFVEWQAMVTRQSDKRVVTLRTDGGSEYLGVFAEHCRKYGITRQITVRHTPEQNGKAERLNRSLMEKLRSVMFGAKLPSFMWADLLSAVCYLKNMSPYKDNEQVPLAMWTGNTVNVAHLQAIGSEVWALVPDTTERGKLAPRAKKLTLIGYSFISKAYVLWDRETNQIELNHQIRMATNPTTPTSREVTLAANEFAAAASSEPDPQTVKQCRLRSDWPQWDEAMKKELASLDSKGVFDCDFVESDLPPGRKPIGSKWVFKIKRKADGTVDKYKARLVAQGFAQQYGLDYDETFAPTLKLQSVRIILAIASIKRLEVFQMDVVTAYLNGELTGVEIYMKLPAGADFNGSPVVRLRKSLYGLKQSGREWNAVLHARLVAIGYVRCVADQGMYVHAIHNSILGVYVDDFILATSSESHRAELLEGLREQFEAEDLGLVSSLLGMQVKRVVNEDNTFSYSFSQGYYIDTMLEEFGMADCATATTVFASGVTLGAIDESRSEEELRDMAEVPYRELVGRLSWLAQCTRPDIMFCVNVLARYLSRPGRSHWLQAKHILRYLKGSRDVTLEYSTASQLYGYSDSDYAADPDKRHSTNGYVFFLGGSAITWSSRLQRVLASSTTEAEYYGLGDAAKEAIWLRELLKELRVDDIIVDNNPTVIFGDNQGALALAKNPAYHRKTKHIEVAHHLVRELVERKVVEFRYVRTESMVADVLTKNLNKIKVNDFRTKMGLTISKSQQV